ncbi:MAG TPA: TonB family protein [Vicinamibacterales bacterium]|nr:TonB family protein [Vicinamibacterales bacterium]HPW21073.1 TonB family protein [Vicinamibacterales bacterium]
MYFNFDDRELEQQGIERAISWHEGLLLSLLVHAVGVLAIVFLPDLMPGVFKVLMPDTSEAERRIAVMREREANQRRFVFVQPREEFEAKRPPENPEPSDRDRVIMTPSAPLPDPRNTLPYSRGNTIDRVDQPGSDARPAPREEPAERAGSGTEAGTPAPGPTAEREPSADDPVLRGLRGPRPPVKSGSDGSGSGGGVLGDALRNVTRYVPQQMFDNPQGGGQFGSAIQFDTKGVEFGPWVRRFIAQIKRNWFIPYAAMSLSGHVAVSFNVHKDGTITQLGVVEPSGVEAFNNSSFNAIAASNPTQPLPPEYPADRAFFTVTFYYNEIPPR